MLKITLPDDIEECVNREASRRGVPAQTLAVEILGEALRGPGSSPQPVDDSATLAMLEELRLDYEAMKTDDPVELARRDRENREFLRAIDRHANDKPEAD